MIWIERRTGHGCNSHRLHQKKIMVIKKTGSSYAERPFNERGRPIDV